MYRFSRSVVIDVFVIAVAASVSVTTTAVRSATPAVLATYGADTNDPPPVGHGGACNETALPNCNYPNPPAGCNKSVGKCLATIQNPQGICRRVAISTPCTENTACTPRLPHACN